MTEQYADEFLETVRKRGRDLEENPSKFIPLEKLEFLNELDVNELEQLFQALEDE